jgi:hypothetical protein
MDELGSEGQVFLLPLFPPYVLSSLGDLEYIGVETEGGRQQWEMVVKKVPLRQCCMISIN